MIECRKKAYRSWQHASNDARAIRHKNAEATTEVYRCRQCHAWHVGNAAGVLKRKGKRPIAPDIDDE